MPNKQRETCGHLQLPDSRLLPATLLHAGKVLGKGQFGTTRLAVHKKDGAKYAVKSVAKRKLRNHDDVEDIRREVQIMHHLAGGQQRSCCSSHHMMQ